MRRDVRRSGPAGVGLVVLAVWTFAACGNTNHDSAGAAAVDGDQPASNGILAPAELVDLPTPGSSQVSDGPTEQGGVWTESFSVAGLSPAETMDFYVTAFENTWTTTSQPAALADCVLGRRPAGNGGCTYRGRWINGTETSRSARAPTSPRRTTSVTEPT